MGACAPAWPLTTAGRRAPARGSTVPDMTEVLAEAYALVDRGVMREADFREFTFTNAIRLFAGANPDFFKGSAHKWPCGARECGVLFVNKAAQARLWPTIYSAYPGAVGFSRTFEGYGQRDEATMIAFREALAFQDAVGRRAIEARARDLTGQLVLGLSKLPDITLWTSPAAERRAAIVSFLPGSLDAAKLATPALTIDASGGSSLSIEGLEAKTLHVEGSGALQAEIAGRVEQEKVSISGAGSYRADRLRASDVKVSVSGVGNVLLHAGRTLPLPLQEAFEHALLVLSGDVAIDGEPLQERVLYYVGTTRSEASLSSRNGGRLLLIGGPPFPETILMWWNFVSRTEEEIAQARADWEAGQRFGNVTAYRGPRLSAPSLVRFARPNPVR